MWLQDMMQNNAKRMIEKKVYFQTLLQVNSLSLSFQMHDRPHYQKKASCEYTKSETVLTTCIKQTREVTGDRTEDLSSQLQNKIKKMDQSLRERERESWYSHHLPKYLIPQWSEIVKEFPAYQIHHVRQ